MSLTATSMAHHPDREHHRVHPYYDLIPPLGNHLPLSYRRKYNRPRKTLGKMAYYFAPSSQEAMAWHNAQHRGYYEHHRPRMVTHYFYPKPWEALRTGARPETAVDGEAIDVDSIEIDTLENGSYKDSSDDLEPIPEPINEPIVGELGLIEP